MESKQQNWKSCQVRKINNYVIYRFRYNSDNSINRNVKNEKPETRISS